MAPQGFAGKLAGVAGKLVGVAGKLVAGWVEVAGRLPALAEMLLEWVIVTQEVIQKDLGSGSELKDLGSGSELPPPLIAVVTQQQEVVMAPYQVQ